MKTSILRHVAPTFLALGLVVFLGGGCGKQGPASGAAFKSSEHAVPEPAQTNSFQEVAAYLDPGGSFYLYLDTEQWLRGLSGKIEDLRSVFTSLPNMKPEDRVNVGKLLDVVYGLVKASGIEEISGVGASGILVEPGMYRNRFILHHYPGRNQGLLWTMFGKEPHALSGIDFLPPTTALASFSDVDVPMFWKALKDQVQQANLPELSKGLAQVSGNLEKQFGLTLDQLLATFGGQVGFVLTLDDDKLVTLPGPRGGRIEFPQPALALVFKVTDDTIFKRLAPLLEKNPQVIKTDEGDLHMRSLPLPFPFPVKPTVAYSGEYLFLASSDKLVQNMVALKQGKGPNLKDNEEFAKISKGIPLQGNSFTYVSPEVSRTVAHLIDSAAFAQAQSGKSDGGAEMLRRLMGDGQESFAFSVASNTRDGWVIMGHSSQHPALAFLGPTLIAPTAIIAGMALPAMAKAKQKAQTISCVNNLKQIGLAARMYANQHGDVYPKDFVSMKDELSSPRILVCPADKSKTPATSWATFNEADASYVIVTPGAKATDPQTVFARCPIHGNVCLVDGSVQQGQRVRGR